MKWIEGFVPEELPEGDRTAARILVGLAWGLVAATLIGLWLRLALGALEPGSVVIVLVCTLAYGAVPWLLRRTGSLRLPGIVLNLSLLVLIVTSTWYAGGLGGPVTVIAPLVPLVATFLFSGRTGLWVTLLLAAALTGLFALAFWGVELPRPELSERRELVARALYLGITLTLTAFFAGLYDRQRSANEEQLRKSRDLYQKLFDQSKDIVALTTYDGRLVDLNPAGLELVGYRSKDELLDTRVASLYADPDRRRQLLERLEADGYVRDYESELQTRNGDSRIVEGTTTTICDESGNIEYLLAILRDVTEKRRAEAEREALLAEVTRKKDHLDQFSHAVSHDLKSPLMTVRGFIGLLLRDVRDERYDRLEKFADSVDRGAEKMALIIDGLLQLAQIGRGKLARGTVELGDLALDAVEMLGERINAAGASVEVAADLPARTGDPALLLTVLENLIDNAVKYGSGDSPASVEVGWRLDGDEPVITVTDDGPGIAPKHHQAVFEPFRQLQAGNEGAGIGLASVRRAIQAHGGRIWVESDGDGRGTAFCFTIPDPSDGSEVVELGILRDLHPGGG